MSSIRVRCPGCRATLSVPQNVGQHPVRCGACRATFQVAPFKPTVDDTVLGWLFKGKHDEESDAAPAGHTTHIEAPIHGELPELHESPVGEGIRLVSLERRGTLFEFPSDRLRDEHFRCSLPRVCVHCLGRVHLSAHLVIYTNQLRDSISQELERQAGNLTIAQDRLGEAVGPGLLALLPEVPNVPPPAHLPMPYWVCDLCSGAGEISGQIHIHTGSGHGTCRLLIRNLHVASSFLCATGAEGSNDIQRLRDFVAKMQEDRWDAVPSVVRHRLEQWFRPAADERFLAYVPDRAFARTEDGMVGLVVSSTRMIYHHPPIHQEVPYRHPLTFQVSLSGGKELTTIESMDFKKRTVTLDRGGMMLLRRALSEGHYKAIWK